MNNIIVFATYWNEREWIEASLAQILKIDPVEIIICDGNFDPQIENRSTDGTRELIEQFVADQRGRARLISAERCGRLSRGGEFLRGAGRGNQTINLARLDYSLRCQFVFHQYRVNQALTFAKMMSMSNHWAVGKWVMTYDADQFYTDDLIDKFSLTNRESAYDLITAEEWTFPSDFGSYCKSYERRTWNNMPHKIKPRMAVYPTRHFVQEGFMTHRHLHSIGRHFLAGKYFHYKFRQNLDRAKAGYALGDRVQPKQDRFTDVRAFTEEHPETIRRYFNL